jgi:AraC-like DNA-binding protein
MDVLSDVLRVVHLSGAVFFSAEFSSPWAIESPNRELLAPIVMPESECLVVFHILIEGGCLVESSGLPSIRLDAGDVVVLPRGESHTMRSGAGVDVTPVDQVISPGRTGELAKITLGGGGDKASFICGYLNCDQRFLHVVSALPRMLVVRCREDYTAIEAVDRTGPRPTTIPRGPSTWLATTLKFTVHEARTGRPGNGAMLGRLAELMFVEIVREYMQHMSTGRGGWLAGLQDQHVGPALRLIHEQPMRKWTVSALAREVALSRSALAQRFTDFVGEAPMRYLARWRIQVAKQLIREGHSVQTVATRVGYQSEAAFNRAFKRLAGAPPATWRKAALSICALLTLNDATWLSLFAEIADLISSTPPILAVWFG